MMVPTRSSAMLGPGSAMTARTQGLEEEYLRREGEKLGEFRYYFPNGAELLESSELERIGRLAVPPGYREVFVSPDPDAELQAFGRDSQGRLQYRYHPDFSSLRAQNKWSRLVKFSSKLTGLRQTTGVDLRRSTLEPRKVLALMTRLLYVAHFRVGSDEYARKHKTFGLSTLSKRHVKVSGSSVEFQFRGKHRVSQHKVLTDPTLARNVGRLLKLPGPHLWQALEGEQYGRVTSSHLNAYLREVMGPFTAKDFRTWGGTLLAAEFLAEAGAPESDRTARKTLLECVRFVAEDLGNTPTVVRAHYVSPWVFDRYLEGKVLDDFEPRAGRIRLSSEAGLSRSELALKRMLEQSAKQSKRTTDSSKQG